MFDVAPTELIVLGTVALMVIPPKDLPRAMRMAGYWVGRARGVARQFRSGFDTMVRDAELAEMEQRWTAENERIMREHPAPLDSEINSAAGGFNAATAITDPSPVVDRVPSAVEVPISVEEPMVEPATTVQPSVPEPKASS